MHARFGLYWIRDSLSVERGFRILVVSKISNFLELNSATKAQDSGIRITLFRTIGMADFQRDIHYIIMQCGSRNQGRKQDLIPWLSR